MKKYVNPTIEQYHNLVNYLNRNRKTAVSSIISMGLLGGGILGFELPTNLWYWPAIYVAVIIIPIILGMAGKIDFKWVVLWECVVLLPFLAVILLIFGGLILTGLRRA